ACRVCAVGSGVVAPPPTAQQGGEVAASPLRSLLFPLTPPPPAPPPHFFQAGLAIDGIAPHILMGPAGVCAFPDVTTHLTADDLRPLALAGTQRLLFKTPNSALWERTGFQTNYVALTESAAHLLVDLGVQLV